MWCCTKLISWLKQLLINTQQLAKWWGLQWSFLYQNLHFFSSYLLIWSFLLRGYQPGLIFCPFIVDNSNHWQLDCLVASSGFDNKISRGLHSRPFVKGIHLWLVDSPHSGPVMSSCDSCWTKLIVIEQAKGIAYITVSVVNWGTCISNTVALEIP